MQIDLKRYHWGFCEEDILAVFQEDLRGKLDHYILKNNSTIAKFFHKQA